MARSKKAVVLLSGGLDSATVLYWALARGWQPHALIFDYGQRHGREIASAKALCKKTGVAYDVIPVKLPWRGSSLLDKGSALPHVKRTSDIGAKIPSTYVPGRNTLFLSYGLSCAEVIGAKAVMIGANALDYSGYPDCRPDFIAAMSKVYTLGTKAGREGNSIKIVAPLIRVSKSQIIELGIRLGVPCQLTWSCYRGGKKPCGTCDSCLLRAKGFKEAGIVDPTVQEH